MAVNALRGYNSLAHVDFKTAEPVIELPNRIPDGVLLT